MSAAEALAVGVKAAPFLAVVLGAVAAGAAAGAGAGVAAGVAAGAVVAAAVAVVSFDLRFRFDLAAVSVDVVVAAA